MTARPDQTVAGTLHHVQRPATPLPRIITPGRLDEALSIMAEYRERAKPLAGGTDLLVEFDRAAHGDIEVLVDLTRVADLDRIEGPDDVPTAPTASMDRERRSARLAIGATVTHARCVADPRIHRFAPPLAQACLEVGSPQLRNRATVAGNLATASPANDTISALSVLDAELTLTSIRGSRTVPIAEFFQGIRRTVLEPDELITSISFDALDERWRAVYLKLGLRRSQAISVVHLALACRFTGETGTVVEARLALGSVAPTIVRCPEAESALVGGPISEETTEEAAEAAARSVSPIDDLRSSAEYRRLQVAEMTRRALTAVADGHSTSVSADDSTGTVRRRPILLDATGGAWPTGPSLAADHPPGAEIVSVVNGLERRAPATGETLLAWIRSLGLTGTKEGCAEGECGACTIHLDDKAVLACLVPDTRAHGATVTTVEGVGADHGSLQEAFVEAGGVQCGFCIPGFIMSAAKLMEERDDRQSGTTATDDNADIRAGLAGNLCRCTGYYRIIEAVQADLAARRGEVSP